MNKTITVALSVLFATGVALAQTHLANLTKPGEFPANPAEPAKKAEAAKQTASNCEAKAVGKDGKPLSGDAKTTFMKKCEAGASAAK